MIRLKKGCPGSGEEWQPMGFIERLEIKVVGRSAGP
jgi:hypothetical protein